MVVMNESITFVNWKLEFTLIDLCVTVCSEGGGGGEYV